MTDLTDRAIALAADGRVTAGVALLDRGCAADDPRALFQRAVWHAVATGGARDLAAARALFARSGRAGHADGALTAIAMTANGSGGSADWAAAHALLRRAAPGDALAAQQLMLLGKMDLAADGRPRQVPAPRPVAANPRILHLPGLLTHEECAWLAHAATDLLAPASVVDPATGRQISHPVRTSHGAAIGPLREDLVTRAINLRIAAASGTTVEQGEPLMILRYTTAQEYRLHGDALTGVANQRIMTVLIYLNDAYRGGETAFPDLDIAFRGRPGDAVLFDTVDAAGRPHPRARHAGRPIAEGVKWLATRWIRAAPIDPWTMAATH